jgi:hypothetical protein
MNRRNSIVVRAVGLVSAFTAAVLLVACSDKLTAGSACPDLCSQEEIAVRDTVISAIEVDTSIVGFPTIGSENFLLLASLGDTLDTRVVVRYDTLPTTYRNVTAAADSNIVRVDSARLNVRIVAPSAQPAAPFTVEAYNVDTTAADTAAAPILALFRPDRFLGSRTFQASDSIKDTLKVPIRNDVVLRAILNGTHLRVGLRVISSISTQLKLTSAGLGTPTTLSFRVTADTATAPIVVSPESRTPADPGFLKTPLEDYLVVAKGDVSTPPQRIVVGGLPASRAYFRFKIPPRIIDSSTVVRASLLLTQAPNPQSPGAKDTLTLRVVPVLASTRITDVEHALGFLSGANVDTLRVVPKDSGDKRIEMVNIVRSWKGSDTTLTPQAIAILANLESELASRVYFFSSTASQSTVRPRLQITYVPHVTLGLP